MRTLGFHSPSRAGTQCPCRQRRHRRWLWATAERSSKGKTIPFSYQTPMAPPCAKCSGRGLGDSEGSMTWVLPSRGVWARKPKPPLEATKEAVPLREAPGHPMTPTCCPECSREPLPRRGPRQCPWDCCRGVLNSKARHSLREDKPNPEVAPRAHGPEPCTPSPRTLA